MAKFKQIKFDNPKRRQSEIAAQLGLHILLYNDIGTI